MAGGWVAVFATLEAREFREIPWYGMLANHAAIAVSAVLAGIVRADGTPVYGVATDMDGVVQIKIATFSKAEAAWGTRRSEFPMVGPKPGSSGPMAKSCRSFSLSTRCASPPSVRW